MGGYTDHTVGDEAKLEPLLSQSGVRPANLTVRHACEVIGSDDEPVKAVRRKKDASMVVAGRMLKEGRSGRDDLGGQYWSAHDNGFACCRSHGRH